MNATTRIKITRIPLTTVSRQRTQGVQTTVIADVAARIERLSGRALDSILGRAPNGTHRLIMRPGVEPKVNDTVTDLRDSNREYRIEDVVPHRGGRRIKRYECILSGGK